MELTEKVKNLIESCKKTGGIRCEQVKGLTDGELRALVNAIVKGGVTGKAVVYSTMKRHI